MSQSRVLLLVTVLLLLCAFFLLDTGAYPSLGYVQAQLDALRTFRDQYFALSLIAYFFAYVLIAALSIPGTLPITLLGGALFGLGWGTVVVSFASSIGATLAFLVSRTLLRGWVQARFAGYLAPINRGMERDGSWYLFSIRMVPIFPFFLVNLVMGLMPIGVVPFYVASQAGMLLLTVAYVNAGSQLAQMTSLAGLVSLPVLLSVALIGMVPLLSRLLVDAIRKENRAETGNPHKD